VTYDDLLVPTDGGGESAVAAARAFHLAGRFDARVHLLAVVGEGDPIPDLTDAAREAARSDGERRGRDATASLQQRAADLGVETTRSIRHGVPHRVIVGYADERDVDLLVMGTAGERSADGPDHGVVTERVLAQSDAPVLVVPADEAAIGPEAGVTAYDQVLVATDGSDAAERAADSGIEIAERYGADVDVTYVVDVAALDENVPSSLVGLLREGGRAAVEAVAAECRARSLPVTTTVGRGRPAGEVLDRARDVDADLVTVGRRGQSIDDERLVGSTMARIVRWSEVPVLTVP
jgi:nucleotide-binding universal stress UspA family protein